MNLSFILMKQTGIMFLLIAAGFILYKKKIVTKEGSKELGGLLLYLIMPSVIIRSFLQSSSTEAGTVLESFLAAGVALLIAILISALIFRKGKKIENFGVSFSNAGFMGIPLVSAVLGSESVIFVTGFVVLVNFLQWTYGVIVMTESFETVKLKRLLKNPILIGVGIGILLLLVPFPIPELVTKPIHYFADMNAPVAMVTLGVYLAQSDLLSSLSNKDNYITSVVRLLVIPGLTLLAFAVLPFTNQTMMLAVLISASAPIGSNVAIFAQLYGQDYKKAVQEVCFSTICSIVTMPVMIAAASAFL